VGAVGVSQKHLLSRPGQAVEVEMWCVCVNM
jgi:hypothetical protein